MNSKARKLWMTSLPCGLMMAQSPSASLSVLPSVERRLILAFDLGYGGDECDNCDGH